MENQEQIIDDQGGGLEPNENQNQPNEQDNNKVVFSDDQQKLLDDIIERRLARERKQHQAQLEAERLEREKLQKQLNPGDEDIQLPEEPDVLDPDYDQKKAEFDSLRIKKETAIARQQAVKDFKAEQAQNQAQAEAESRVQNLKKNAEICGIKDSDLDSYSGNLIQAGAQPDVCGFVLDEKKGPLVAKHLSENPSELDKLVEMKTISERQRFLITLESKLEPVQKGVPPDETKPPAGSGSATEKDWILESTRGASFD